MQGTGLLLLQPGVSHFEVSTRKVLDLLVHGQARTSLLLLQHTAVRGLMLQSVTVYCAGSCMCGTQEAACCSWWCDAAEHDHALLQPLRSLLLSDSGMHWHSESSIVTQLGIILARVTDAVVSHGVEQL